MKRLLLLLLILPGCVDAHLRMGRMPDSKPSVDQHSVDLLVCWGRRPEAELLLERQGLSQAAATDRLVKAEESARRPGSGCCPFPGCPISVPSPEPFDGRR